MLINNITDLKPFRAQADVLLRGYAGWNSRRALQVLEQVFPKVYVHQHLALGTLWAMHSKGCINSHQRRTDFNICVKSNYQYSMSARLCLHILNSNLGARTYRSWLVRLVSENCIRDTSSQYVVVLMLICVIKFDIYRMLQLSRLW